MKNRVAVLLALSILICSALAWAESGPAGEWEGSMFGLSVRLTLEEGGAYSLTLSDYPNAQPTVGTWAAIGNNVIMDAGTASEAVYIFSGDTLKSSDGSTSFTRAAKASGAQGTGAYGLQNFAGVWDAETVLYGDMTLDVNDVGLDMRVTVNDSMITLFSKSMELDDVAIECAWTGGALEFEESGSDLFISLAFEKDPVRSGEGDRPVLLMAAGGEEFHFVLSPADGAVLSAGTQAVAQSADTSLTVYYPILQRGSKGEDVKKLQLRLTELNYPLGSADGDYGRKTKAAVELFQARAGLAVTGIADQATQSALYASGAPSAPVYLSLDYTAISRNPSSYTGNHYTFTGKVLQVLEQEYSDYTLVNLRIATKGNADNAVFVTYRRPKDSDRVLEGDSVTVYGECQGLYSYESVMGSTITLPYFEADTVGIN